MDWDPQGKRLRPPLQIGIFCFRLFRDFWCLFWTGFFEPHMALQNGRVPFVISKWCLWSGFWGLRLEAYQNKEEVLMGMLQLTFLIFSRLAKLLQAENGWDSRGSAVEGLLEHFNEGSLRLQQKDRNGKRTRFQVQARGGLDRPGLETRNPIQQQEITSKKGPSLFECGNSRAASILGT